MQSNGLISRRRSRSVLIAAFAVGVIGIVVLVELRTEDGPDGTLHPGGPRPLIDIFDPAKPLMLSGTRTSLAEVESLAGFRVFTPSAREAETPEVWHSADTREVALRYGTDLVLLLTPWPEGSATDSAAPYDQQAQEMNVGYTSTLNGHPAWVMPSKGDTAGDASVSVVHLMIEGIDVTLYGTMSVDELVRQAESVN